MPSLRINPRQSSRMILLYFLLLAACIFSLGIVLEVACEHFLTTDVPAAIGHTVQLRILHCCLLLIINCGNICEKLGICSKPEFIRFTCNILPIKKDPKLIVKNLCFETVPVRLYQPKAASTRLRKGIIFFHGGGMVFGSLDTHHNLCCYLSSETDSVLLSVGYRLAPEHIYPTAFNDCLTASIHFLRTLEIHGVDPFHITICGDSAGGTLVASICQRLQIQIDLPKIKAQVLIYPYLQGLNFQLPSYQKNKRVPFITQNIAICMIFKYFNIHPSWKNAVMNGAHLSPEIWKKYEKIMSVNNIPKQFKEKGYQPMSPAPFNEDAYQESKAMILPINSPLIADDDIIAQLPGTLLVSCEFDVLRDDTLLYKKRLEDHGVPVSWHHIEDGFHGVIHTFDSKYFFFPCSLKILNIVVNFINNL